MAPGVGIQVLMFVQEVLHPPSCLSPSSDLLIAVTVTGT